MEKIIIKEMTPEAAKELGVHTWNKWNCEPSRFAWEYEDQETAYIYEGDVIVTSGDESVHITENMLVSFPKGMKCIWDVRKTIKKVYTFNFEIK
ncbi:MAG: cupin domain-containing protein [Bacillota bacterium]